VFPSPNSACRYCGRELTPLEVIGGGVCRDWQCRETRLSREADDERRRAAALVRRRGTEAPGGGSGDLDPAGPQSQPALARVGWDSAPTVIVPWRDSTLRPLPDGRREEFLAYLDQLLDSQRADRTGAFAAGHTEASAAAAPAERMAEASADRDARGSTDSSADLSADHDTPPDPLLGQVCAACRGACCHAGGTHAFLDTARMRGIVERMGDASTVRAEYIRRLPERTVQGSCVFHSESGCSLSRELRGEPCNRYECRGLEMARELRATADGGTRVVHVVRREDQVIHDSAFAGEGWLERARRGRGSEPLV